MGKQNPAMAGAAVRASEMAIFAGAATEDNWKPICRSNKTSDELPICSARSVGPRWAGNTE
jgi:hypothetical protein